MCFSLSIVGPSEKSTTNWRWVPGKEKCTGFVLVSSKQSLTGGSKTTTGLGKAPPPKKKLIWENFPKYLNTPQCTAVFLWDLEHKRWNLGKKGRFSGCFGGLFGRFGNQPPHTPEWMGMFSEIKPLFLRAFPYLKRFSLRVALFTTFK